MTTATTVARVITCPNPWCKRQGKRIGEVEVTSETIAVTVTAYCGACRQEHRQTLRIC